MKLEFRTPKNLLYIDIKLHLKKHTPKQIVLSISGSFYEKKYISKQIPYKLISSGQCLDCIPEFVKDIKNSKDKKLLKKIYNLWKQYHLNNTNAWCKHMQYGNFPKTNIKIHKLNGNQQYNNLTKIRELPDKYLRVTEQGLNNIPKALYEYASYDIKRNTHIEIKSNAWITYDKKLSPEGLIGKECPICKAKYGHKWYYKPIHKKILKEIKKIIIEAKKR